MQPRPTYLNLPEEKQRLFRDAALEEFARYPFDSASVTRMVAVLGIAKGSVYQYFDDKVSLFEWLLHEAARHKADLLDIVEVNGWSGLAQLYRSGLHWWRYEPRWARVGMRLSEPSTEPRLAELRRQYEHGAWVWWRDLVARGQREGWVRRDVQPDRAAYFLTGVFTTGLMTAFMAELGSEPDEWIDDAHQINAETFEKALGLSEAMVELARRALGVLDR